MSGPYLASEDSALLRSALTGYSGGRALEIGAGNCGNLIELAKKFDTVVGTDIARPGLTDWKGSGASFVLADAGSCLREESFDLVAFNPPYLRAEAAGDAAVEGGVSLEVPLKFLREALRTVKRTGRVVLLLNTEARLGDFEEECSRRDFRLRRLAGRRLFYEELVVYEASRALNGAESWLDVDS